MIFFYMYVIHAAHVSTVAEMPVRLRMLIQYLCSVARALNNRCAAHVCEHVSSCLLQRVRGSR